MDFAPLPSRLLEGTPLTVARRLLGQRLVRRVDGVTVAGRIVEVEAYGGRDDSTSHAVRGASGRARGMFGPAGRAYIYLIYGMHTCLNVVAHEAGGVGAVLIRALAPETGLDHMRSRRGGVAPHLLTSGPGRLCKALAIERSLDGVDLCGEESLLLLAAGAAVPDQAVVAGPRVGVVGRPEDVAWPGRLYIAGDPNVSPGRRIKEDTQR